MNNIYLEDLMDTMQFEEISLFTEDFDIYIFIETSLHLMNDFIYENPTVIAEPDFKEIMLEEIQEVFYTQFEESILNEIEIEDEIDDMLEYIFEIFINSFNIKCTTDTDDAIKPNEFHLIEEKINILRNIIQPKQRTTEWYEFRNNLITASNAYKAFETPAMINQLIYEKCKPIDTTDNKKFANVNSSLHWGQKYEPLSVMIYEKFFNTQIEDFGCIKHSIYPFLGASPDGINVDNTSPKYGRMLEIKNVVSRIINGIPKKEYWIQMQLQMEVCNLDNCDFLETKFVEYENNETFENDIEYSLEMNDTLKLKGVFMYFQNNIENKPVYIYKSIKDENISNWQNENITTYINEPYNYCFIRTIYWKLETFSCILVTRNKEWFINNVNQIAKVWDIIKQERITGYEHRGPASKKPKTNTSPNNIINYLNIVKLP
jgi:putative phage-type endonuclease